MMNPSQKDDKPETINQTMLIDDIQAELTFDPQRERNAINIHTNIFAATAKNPETDEETGRIEAILGGGVDVTIDGYTWTLRHDQIFCAVKKAHDEWMRLNGRTPANKSA